MSTYLHIIQIITSIALIGLTIMQNRGSRAGGMLGGVDSSIHRTRRGVEKTIFNLTIVFAVVFFLTSLLSVIVTS